MENSLYILGTKISVVNSSQALEKAEQFIDSGQKHLIVTPYSESVVAAYTDKEFQETINVSSLSIPDGGGLLAAADYLQYRLSNNKFLRIILALFLGLWVGVKLVFFRQSFKVLKETVHGTDLLISICSLSARRSLKVYLLGGLNREVAARSAQILMGMFPKLEVKVNSGPANLQRASAEEIDGIISEINDFKPDFLFVAFKPVAQEKWLSANMEKIEAKVFMAVGGAFDMISGHKKRAPRFMRSIGLEWLWRLIIEPSRFKRIYNAVIVFPLLVFKEKLRTG